MSVNKAILVGRAGADPDLRYTAEGTPVATFNLATSDTFRKKDGSKGARTEWHRIVLWKRLAETASQYVKKGTMVYVEGSIRNRAYEGHDGVKRRITEIVALNYRLLSWSSAKGGIGQPSSDSSPVRQPGDDYDDDFVHEPDVEDGVPL